MIRQKIDAIIILGGGLTRGKNGWRTTKFSDKGESDKALGDYLRVLAGSHLYKEQLKRNPDFFILVSGGRGYLRKIKGVPAIADVLEKELIKLGVPQDKIYKERKSNSTYQQLKMIANLSSKNEWKKIGIISNSYHLPRIKALIENINDLRFLKRKLREKNLLLISAENALLRHGKKKWKNIIERAQKSEWMKNRLILERRGIKQLKLGLYKLR